MASASTIAQHNVTDAAEAASIGARVDPKSGKWFSLTDGHYIAPAEADQLLGRTTAQGNADRAQGNGGGWLDQLVSRNQDSVGNLIKNVAPLAAIIPGVGPILSAGLGAAGQAIIPGSNLGNDIKQGAVSGAEGLGAAALGGALGVPGLSTPSLGSAANSVAKGVGAATAPSSGGSGMSGIPGLSTITNALGLGNNPLALAQAANEANLISQAQGYATNAANQAQANYNAKAPLRAAGISGMLNAQAPDLSGLTAIRGSNPFAAVPVQGSAQASPLGSPTLSAAMSVPTTQGASPSGVGLATPAIAPAVRPPVSALPIPGIAPVGGGQNTPQTLAM